MRKKLLGKQAWTLGVGAGFAGLAVVALKFFVRSATKLRVPDSISPAVFSTKVVNTALGETVYHEAGSGQPLIFVHDICCGGSSYEWSKVCPAFVRDHRVIALDLVGFGESARPARRFTAADYVGQLADFVRAVTRGDATGPAVFVASGLGAGFCAALAVAHPELVGGMVFYRPNGGGEFGLQPISAMTKVIYRQALLGRFLYRNHLSTRKTIVQWLREEAFSQPEKVSDVDLQVFATCAQQPGAEHAVLSWLGGRLAFDFGEAALKLRNRVQVLESGALLAALETPEKMASAVADGLDALRRMTG